MNMELRHATTTRVATALLLAQLLATCVFYIYPLTDFVTQRTTTSSSRGHPPILYGHVHMAKTGGTSLNGIFANKFEHVCGHKGYSYDAYQENERAKQKGDAVTLDQNEWSRSRVDLDEIPIIGFEECDYVSNEIDWRFWTNNFGDAKFHETKMELHVPCRDRIQHLMSMCNHEVLPVHVKKTLACDAEKDEVLFDSVKKCLLHVDERYNPELLRHFDVKCYNFNNQFTGYAEYMSGILTKRRFESTPYVRRETNGPHNKENECIWKNPQVMEKVDKFLLDTVPYYEFCNSCIGSENEIGT